jgi:hypothetical protein
MAITSEIPLPACFNRDSHGFGGRVAVAFMKVGPAKTVPPRSSDFASAGLPPHDSARWELACACVRWLESIASASSLLCA